MGKWIDTDAAYAVLTDYYHHSTDTQHAALREALGRVETVDAVPVVHSEWIPKEKADTPYGLEMECAKCGFPVIVNDALYFKFCPQCGAKMDGKDGEGRE